MASRIEDYGLIGNGRTAALVSRNADIDWLCAPRFDSDACFASLLGYDEHGHWSIYPSANIREKKQRYRGDTLILETEFFCDGGAVRVMDFMPVEGNDATRRRSHRRGPGGRGPDGDAAERALRLRRRDPGDRAAAGRRWFHLRPQRHGVPGTGRGDRQASPGDAESARQAGRSHPADPVLAPVSPARPRGHRRLSRAGQDRGLLARVGGPLQIRWAVSGRRVEVAHHAEGHDVRADRGHRGGSDVVVARGRRRRTQLGLPLLLVA